MSWANVRPYFQGLAESAGFSEWPDGFAFDNIPSNLLDRSYHTTLGPLTGVRQNQTDQETNVDVDVRVFFKGYNNPAEAIDTAISEMESFVKSCVNPATRTETAGLLNVVFNELTLDPFDASNDNAIVATAGFTVRVIINVGP